VPHVSVSFALLLFSIAFLGQQSWSGLIMTMAEFFPPVDVEVGNELFWYIFDGEPRAQDGFIDLDDNVPGFGLTINEERIKEFQIIE
jgi:hypothetical protein